MPWIVSTRLTGWKAEQKNALTSLRAGAGADRDPPGSPGAWGLCFLAILVPVDLHSKGRLFSLKIKLKISSDSVSEEPVQTCSLQYSERSKGPARCVHPSHPGRLLNKALHIYVSLLLILKDAPVFTILVRVLSTEILPGFSFRSSFNKPNL